MEIRRNTQMTNYSKFSKPEYQTPPTDEEMELVGIDVDEEAVMTAVDVEEPKEVVAPPNVTMTGETKTVVVNTRKLNFRARPVRNSEVIEVLKAGDKLETTDDLSNEWIEAMRGDEAEFGYVMAEFVKPV